MLEIALNRVSKSPRNHFGSQVHICRFIYPPGTQALGPSLSHAHIHVLVLDLCGFGYSPRGQNSVGASERRPWHLTLLGNTLNCKPSCLQRGYSI